MAIIAFWSEEEKETGQTLSMAGLLTYMGIEHNYKLLGVGTEFGATTLEDCFWDPSKGANVIKKIAGESKVGIDSGIEGLLKIIQSNKTSSDIIGNYTKIVFKNRLDILPSPKTTVEEEYDHITSLYPQILQTANKSYDLVFVDMSKKIKPEYADKILEIADVVIVNITQRLRAIDHFLELREENEFFKRRNVMLAIGRYDKFSKYSNKNVTRYLKEKKPLCVIPYNTLFFEACAEGKITEFFLRMRNLDEADRNAVFMKEIGNMSNAVIYKIQELQMKM